MTLPTIAGVQSRIHTLPGRPPFMIADDLAEFYQTTPKRLMEQVRRNIGRFPDGFIFELTEAEFREKSPQFAATSQGKRTDLVHYGFTEKGALQLASVLGGPVADAVSVTIIDAFIALRDQERSDMTTALWKFRTTWCRQKALRSSIVSAVAEGMDWQALRAAHRSTPQWVLVTEIHESLFFGTITMPPRGTPMHLRQPEPKLPAVTPETDPRQTLLFGEG